MKKLHLYLLGHIIRLQNYVNKKIKEKMFFRI